MRTQPNILIVMTDQQRGDVGLPGHLCQTPVLDRFRRRGVTFAEAFCPSPHCCPSRATFFTGLYPSEHGVWNNVAVQNALSTGLKPGVRLWSEDLADAGYQLHFNGKWHVSFTTGPSDHGWQEHLVNAGPQKNNAKTMGPTWAAYEALADEPIRTEPRQPGEMLRPGWGDRRLYGQDERPFGDQDVVDRTVALLANAPTTQPWVMYCGLLGPHDPYFVPQRFLDLYSDVDIPLPENFRDTMADKPAFYRRTRRVFDQLSEDEHREAIRHYWAFCSYEDWLFGKILEALAASGQEQDTIVMFTSDHGDYAAEHGLWCKGLPCFRGAYHIPLIIAGPGIVADHMVTAPISLADIAPTIRALTGTTSPQASSGFSLLPWLRGEIPAQWRDALYTQTNGNEQYGIQRSVTTAAWKYVHNGFDEDELYDLRHDPGEVHNVAGDTTHAAIIQEMCTKMWTFARQHDDPCINSYIMVGMAPFGPGTGCAKTS